jgi:hypothetical protein
VFTNVDNTISGAGHLGEGQLTMVNQGTINATGSHALDIDTGANMTFNFGMLEASGAGGLVVRGDVDNSGTLWANNSNITIEGDVTGGGSAVIDGNGSFVFDGLFAEALTINATASGTLAVSHASYFSGTISGFDGNDHLLLNDISAATASLNYTANADGTGGVLSVSDGTHAANIILQGQYDAAEFQYSANATGGTSVTLVPHNDHLV